MIVAVLDNFKFMFITSYIHIPIRLRFGFQIIIVFGKKKIYSLHSVVDPGRVTI